MEIRRGRGPPSGNKRCSSKQDKMEEDNTYGNKYVFEKMLLLIKIDSFCEEFWVEMISSELVYCEKKWFTTK